MRLVELRNGLNAGMSLRRSTLLFRVTRDSSRFLRRWKKQSSALALLKRFVFRKLCFLGVVDRMTLEPVRIPGRAHIPGGAVNHARREVAGLPAESREEPNRAAHGSQNDAFGNAPVTAGDQALQQAGTRSDGRQSEI